MRQLAKVPARLVLAISGIAGLVVALASGGWSRAEPPLADEPGVLGPYDGVVLSWKQDITLAARFDRQLVELRVDEGDLVSAGDLLARLDDAEARLAVAERKAAVERAKAEVALQKALLEESRAQLEANAYLRRKNAISQEEYRQSEVRVQVQQQRVVAAERDLEQATVALAQAELLLQMHSIHSPINGRVVRVFYRRGAFIDRTGENGMRLFRIVNVDVLRAVARVPLADTLQVRRGQPVQFQVDMPSLRDTDLARKVFHGKVTFLGQIDPVDGTREIWADIRNEGRLLEAHMVGRLSILTGSQPRQVRLPAGPGSYR